MKREIFEDLKILDFGWAIAGPWTVKYLADHGATVIHVESRHHPDLIRVAPPFKDGKPGMDRSFYWANYHCNKYGLSLNMRHSRAIEVNRRLVEWADVLVENFAPGVMKRWGLSYDQVKKINPNIIMISSTQLGQEGPRANLSGTGVQLTAYSGFNNLTGWEDREPSVLFGGFTDCPAARFGSVVLLAALLYRRRTGKGMHIDISQYEAGLHLISPVLMDYHVNRRVAVRNGNRHPFAVPHGVYKCLGDDAWCAITVFSHKHWERLCRAMGNPEWSKENRFATFSKRKENEGDLDRYLGQWTSTMTTTQALFQLQQHEVPSGIVQKGEDLCNDPQLKEFGYFWEVEHSVIGRCKLKSHAFNLSKTPRRLRMPAPCLGEHTKYVCCKLLKLPFEKFEDLLKDGVFE